LAGPYLVYAAWPAVPESALFGHVNGIRCLAFGPAGDRLFSGGMDGTVACWDLTLGGNDGRVLPPADPLDQPDNHNSARLGGLWPAADGTVWKRDTHLGVLDRFDPAGYRPVRRVPVHGLTPRNGQFAIDFAVSPDGTRLLGRADKLTPQVWDTATGTPAGPPPPLGRFNLVGAGFSRDGRLAAAVGVRVVNEKGGPCRAVVWDVATGAAEAEAVPPGRDYWDGLAFLPDGRLALGVNSRGGPGGGLDLFDPATGDRTRLAVDGPTAVRAVVASPCGRWAAGICAHNGSQGEFRIYLWDVSAGTLAWSAADVGAVTGLGFSPDGERLAAARYDDRVAVWRSATGGTVLVKAPASDRIGDSFFPARAVFTADGRRLVANHANGRLSVWAADPPDTDPEAVVAARAAEAEAARYGFHLRAAAELAADPTGVGFRLHRDWLARHPPPTERCRQVWDRLRTAGVPSPSGDGGVGGPPVP
jgi:WD40 repeat protein